MGRYASKTGVSVDKSRTEIEATLKRYGAGAFMYMTRGEQVIIGFEVHSRQMKMELNLPPLAVFHRQKNSRVNTDRQANAQMDQEHRRRWRALALVVKAKLEAVETGIATFEQEFLAYMVLPGGKTVAEELVPKLAAFYDKGQVPRLLAGPKDLA